MSNALRVALLFPLSDEGGWIGQQCLHAARMAIELARERGRIRDGQVELVPIDARHPRADGYDMSKVDAEAARLIGELGRVGATAYIGTISSALALRLASLADGRPLLHWEGVAAADDLTRADRPLLFRLDTTASAYGSAAADFARRTLVPAWGGTLAATRTAVLQMEEDFCRSVATAFAGAARRAGMDVVAHLTFPALGADTDALMAKLRELRPDVLFVTGFGPVVPELWRAARRQRLAPKALIGNGAFALAHRVDQLGADIEGVFLVDTPHVSSMGTQGLTEDARRDLAWWKERCVDPHSTKTAVDRDLVFIATGALVGDVLPRAASTTAADLARAATDVDIPEGGTILGYGVRFDGRRENARSFAAILQWQDRERVTVWPPAVANASPRTDPLPGWDDR